MIRAPLPEHESERLATLQEYPILDTQSEPAFDDLAQLAAYICRTPIALVSFVGAERQRFQACVGISVTGSARDVAFCAHTLLGDSLFVVPDAEADQRFADSPLVAEWGIRFYAGAPVVSPQGHALGALCVMDREPRSLTAEQQRALRILAQQVRGQLERQQLVTRAEADIAAVLEAAPDGILVVDRSGVIELANRQIGRLFGYQPKELLAQPIEMLIPQWHREQHAELWRAYAEVPRTRPMGEGLELTARRKEGSEFPAEVRLAPTTSGEELRVVATIRDVSRRKQMESELRDREPRYREIFDAAAVSIWEEDFSEVKAAIDELKASGIGDIGAYLDEHPQFVRRALRAVRIVDVNPQSLKLFGADTKEDLMASLDRIFLPETVDVFREELVAIAEGKRYFEAEAPARTLQGERREMLFTVSFPAEEEPFHRVLVSTLDITERKRMEEALRASEADYRGLVEYATYGIYRSTVDGRFITVNPALVTMLGYDSADELMSVDIVRQIYADASDHARLMQDHQEHASTEGVEVDWRRKDGSSLTVRLSGRPVRSESGEVECYEMIAEDVTEGRRLEAQLRQAQKMEAIGQLTGGIAHDFNNLLTVVLANADIVASSLPAEVQELRTDLEDVRAAARRGTAMIKKLLSFSRQAILQQRSVDLQALISDLASVLRRLLPEHIQIEVCLEDAGGTVEADPGAVEQILLNLATNARDAMPCGGRLRIEIDSTWLDEGYHAAHPWCPSGDYVRVSVSDTGEGMDAETQEHLFEPFFTTKPVEAGTGLGMAMVYGLMKQHRGCVNVYSEVGRGTVVHLYFPTSSSTGNDSRPTSGRESPLRGTETILVVEDEEAIRRSTKRALENQGYQVLLAADGEEGLEVLRARGDEIDLVITDLVMPRLGGRQLFDTVKCQGSPVRFLFTSGYPPRAVPENAGFTPSVPLLHKPWTVNELATRVREVLEGRSANVA